MSDEPAFRLVETERARERAEHLFDLVSSSLRSVLPPAADIRHVGATSVAACLTKGDLDVVIRVPAADFQQADMLLAARFARNEGSIRTVSFSAFEDASTDPHLGIQLAVIDGHYDFFHQFAEALRRSPDLVDEYNALKRAHENGEMAVYRAAKDAFVARVLAGAGPLDRTRSA